MLSVVIITKNEENNIQRAIDSCLKISPGEIIIVDSNSSDATQSIVNENIKIHSHIKLIVYSSPPYTAARGRNIGAKNISKYSTHILFLDGDMEIDEQFISAGMNELMSDSSLAIVMGQMSNYFYDESYNLVRIEDNVYDLEKHIIGGAMLVTSGPFLDAGYFNSELISNEESELEYRLNKLGYYTRRIPTKMINHHTEISRSIAQIRTRISNGRISALGINLYFGLKDAGYLKRLIQINPQIFLSLMALIFLPIIFVLGSNLATSIILITYILYIKFSSGRFVHAVNYCMYAIGMLVGLILYSISKSIFKTHQSHD